MSYEVDGVDFRMPLYFRPAMSTHKIEALTVAERVCSRPKMYTASGSLAEVLAFLEGYDLAWQYGGRARDDSPSQALRWLGETCSTSKKYDFPSQHLEEILRHFGSEAVALDSIAAFLKAQRRNDA